MKTRFVLLSLITAGIALLKPIAYAIDIRMVPVGDIGNVVDSTGFGSVNKEYWIGVNEVTNAQYAQFLNSVDREATNDLGLYFDTGTEGMASSVQGGISINMNNSPGTRYVIRPNMGNKPVNYVDVFDAARFINWLHNGQGSGSTETGVYDLANFGITRSANARFWLPSENEWYKAAYYDPTLNSGNGGYWDYPTRTNDYPTLAHANSVGDISNPGENVVNHRKMANWNGTTDGNVTTVGSAGSLSKSFYGTNDQGGNLWEFTETAITDSYDTGSARVADGAFRGGSFLHNAIGEGDLHRTARVFGGVTDQGFMNLGFRIAGVTPIDTDGDGVPDQEDACADSIMSETVIIEECDSGVSNLTFEDGCTLADIFRGLADNSSNHGKFVSGLIHFVKILEEDGMLSEEDGASLVSCALH